MSKILKIKELLLFRLGIFDGCAIVVVWFWVCYGGFVVWSVFGLLLMCIFGGDYG